MRWFERLFGSRVTVTKVSRPMTPAEEKAFDKVFGKMRETFTAMDEFFDVANLQDGSPPPPEGSPRSGKRK